MGARPGSDPAAASARHALDLVLALLCALIVASADGGVAAAETTVAAVDTASGAIELADALPAGMRAGQLRLYANVVRAGHGETRAARVLGNRYYLDTGGWMDGRGHFSLLQLDTLELQRWPRAD